VAAEEPAEPANVASDAPAGTSTDDESAEVVAEVSSESELVEPSGAFEESDPAVVKASVESVGGPGESTDVATDVSVPVPRVIVPPGRPEWIDASPFRLGDVDHVPVSSGPFATRAECRTALREAMNEAVAEYVDDHLDKTGASKLVDFDPFHIKSELCGDDLYEEIVQASFGPMHQRHALLKFGPTFRDDIDLRWKHVKVTSRLKQVTLGLGAVLAALGTIFAYLRLDAAARGQFSGRLQFAAAAAILALVASGVLVARWIPWM